MDITGKQSRVYTFGLSILWHNFLIFFCLCVLTWFSIQYCYCCLMATFMSFQCHLQMMRMENMQLQNVGIIVEILILITTHACV